MKDLEGHKKIAVLIDADNSQYSKIKLILEEISVHGHMVIKRAYGDWSSDYLKNWKTALNELAIQPIQQFAYTVGKNSTDASMIIDAMDLLYSDQFDAFVLVSSDSDFTKLASRLRESNIFVFGVGEKKTPVAFRNACDDFIYTENLNSIEEKTKKVKKRKTKKEEVSQDETIIHVLLKAWERYQDEDGWANVASAGNFVKRAMPDFDPRSYGVTKLSEVIVQLDESFDIKRYKGNGDTMIYGYRPKP